MPETTGPNLTQVAYYGRQGIKFTVVLLVVLIVGRVVLTSAVNFWIAVNPPPPPPPTVGFGKLPALHFPAKTDAEKPSSYTLQTSNGGFPRFPDRMKVYLMTAAPPSLLADQRAKEIAGNFGYIFAPTVLNDRTYRWTKTQPLASTLNLDIQDHTFSVTSNYLTKPELLAQKNLPDEQAAVELVKSFVNSGDPVGEDIATVSGSVSYLKAIGGEVSPAVSFSDADFLKVDLSRAPVDDRWKSYTPTGIDGIIHAVVTGSYSGRDQVMELSNSYRPVEYGEVHTYPLRSVQKAWQVLQAGEGYIAQKGGDAAVIREVSLGYYDDTEPQEYFQPIYIFTGDNGFMGYVSAVDPLWVGAE